MATAPSTDRLPGLPAAVSTRRVARAGALVAALALVASFALVLHGIVATVRDPVVLTVVVLGAVLAATVLWPVLSTRRALLVGGVVLVGGQLVYAAALPFDLRLTAAVAGTLELLTGRSLLWMVQADRWAVAIAPAPAFATWFLALQREYVRAAVVGGAAVCFLVLTGDAGPTTTLLGVVAAGALVGFGDIERNGEGLELAEYLLVVLAVMVVAPFLIAVVPGGSAGPLSLVDGGTGTLEANVVGTGQDLDIVGGVDQNPELRFVVRGEEPRYWRTGSYDRYVGDGWVRSGESEPYSLRALSHPPGLSRNVEYEVEARTALETLPAPWRPVGLQGDVTEGASVGPGGELEPGATLLPGDSYTVTSALPESRPTQLATAGTDYPDAVTDRYAQLPATTPDRVETRTREIAAGAENPYQTALVVEEWLETNREYSLDVDRPDGDVADAFLFEMERGYCTYYATAMVGMLRSVDIPARLAVGYTAGEPVGDGEWAVRGTDSHAWVEVYFPDQGWVTFDPTPAGPRSAAQAAAVAGSGTGGDVDGPDVEVDFDSDTDRGSTVEPGREDAGTDSETDSGEPGDPDDTPDNDTGTSQYPTIDELDPDTGPGVGRSPEVSDGETNTTAGPDASSGDDGGTATDDPQTVDPGSVEAVADDGPLVDLPARRTAVLGLVALLGLSVAVGRSRVPDVLGREVRVRFQRRRDPERDIERAHERLLLVLERRHRPREQGETVRQYLDAVGAGPEARRLAAIRERARYAGDISGDAADEAVELVDSVRRGD